MAGGTRTNNAPSKRRRIANAADSRAVSGANRAANRPTKELAPIIRLAAVTFRHELPELLRLRTPRRQWVAYEGSRRLGFGASKHELFIKCVQQGAKRGNLYLRYLAPEEPLEAEVLFDA